MKFISHRTEKGHDIIRVEERWWGGVTEREYIREGSLWFYFPSWEHASGKDEIELNVMLRRVRWEEKK